MANLKLYAVELDTICSNPLNNTNCQNITSTNASQSVENSKDFVLVGSNRIIFNSSLGSFTNRGTIIGRREGNANDSWIEFSQLGNFTNYGIIDRDIRIKQTLNTSRIENYGTMGSIAITDGEMTILNVGTMGAITTLNSYSHTKATVDYRSICEKDCSVGTSEAVFINYGLQITRTADDYNNGRDNGNSRIVTNTASFYDANSKIILDFGGNFEFGKLYSLNRIIHNGSHNTALFVDFYRLTLHNPDIYRLTQSGDYFIVNELSGGEIHTPITESNKNNVVVMNNFFLTSNFVIYRQKIGAQRLTKRKRTPQRRVIRKKVSNLFQNHNLDESIESNDLFAYNNTNPLELNETFFYDSQSYLANNRQTRTMRTRNLNTTNQSTNPSAKSKANRATQSTQSDKYYFILTPYVNHNLYFKAGNYNLSGLDGGFITAFSGRISPSNYLGTHFGFSYGNLSDKGDKAFSIKSANLMLGLNYKFDMIWNMYIKARGDFYYFINEISSNSVATIKPNNIGFGVSVAYGKDFNFGKGGVLGAELGIDYKALSANTLNVKSALNNSALQDYDKALYNLIYLDLGANYHKYFGDFGLNARLGIRGNLAPKLAKSKLIVSNKSLDILIDNDKFAGYISVGGSYVLNAKDFDMEFSLAFNGIYGDRAMSNGGSLEWRVSF